MIEGDAVCLVLGIILLSVWAYLFARHVTGGEE